MLLLLPRLLLRKFRRPLRLLLHPPRLNRRQHQLLPRQLRHRLPPLLRPKFLPPHPLPPRLLKLNLRQPPLPLRQHRHLLLHLRLKLRLQLLLLPRLPRLNLP